METAGGGWAVIQRRMDGSEDFDRKWKDYVVGFGDLNREFWLGLNKIHRLTESADDKTTLKLRVDLQHLDGNVEEATYNSFQILGLSSGYNLTFSGHSGSNLASLNDNHKNMKFTTRDADNDQYPTSNCALEYKGGWWYNGCHPSRLNAPYVEGKDFIDNVINRIKHKRSFKFSEIKLRQGKTCLYRRCCLICRACIQYYNTLNSVYTDCKEAYDSGERSSGIYTINPDDKGLFKVCC